LHDAQRYTRNPERLPRLFDQGIGLLLGQRRILRIIGVRVRRG
jgi:hypothetical protein